MSDSKEDTTTPAAAPPATAAGDTAEAPPMPKIPKEYEEMARPAIEAARDAARLQSMADVLKQQAARIRDPAERERLWRAAYEKEIEAHGQSKKARAMASGWGQGGAAGAVVSGAVGMGLGNLVGVLLSGVVAVPGVLVGSGVGALRGPIYSVTGLGKGKKKKKGDGEKGEGEEETEGDEVVEGDDEKREGEEDFSDEEEHRAIVEAVRKAGDGEKDP